MYMVCGGMLTGLIVVAFSVLSAALTLFGTEFLPIYVIDF